MPISKVGFLASTYSSSSSTRKNRKHKSIQGIIKDKGLNNIETRAGYGPSEKSYFQAGLELPPPFYKLWVKYHKGKFQS